MSYFDTKLVKRPAAPATEQSKPETAPPAEPAGLFAASTGIRPSGDNHVQPADRRFTKEQLPSQLVTRSPDHRACPLCRGELISEHGLWQCQGRCRAQWVEEGGRLLDLATLPFGVCACCEHPSVLIRTDNGVVCPVSARSYLVLPEGARLRDEAAPYGICLCCTPAMPLMMHGDTLVCRAKPQQRYSQIQGRIIAQPEAPAHDLGATHAAIDAALRRNSARVAIHGLFDLE